MNHSSRPRSGAISRMRRTVGYIKIGVDGWGGEPGALRLQSPSQVQNLRQGCDVPDLLGSWIFNRPLHVDEVLGWRRFNHFHRAAQLTSRQEHKR